VDAGRYPIKRVLGEEVEVHVDVFADGHDAVSVELLFKYEQEAEWNRLPMDFRYNDHWVASFRVEKLGRYQYTVRGWTDPFLTWKRDLKKRQEAGQDLTIDLRIGSQILGAEIEDFDAAMAAELPPPAEDKTINYEKVLQVVVEPVRARFSSWYELFPRSFGGFKGVIEVLPYVAKLGFNVLYLPPVHPIGTRAQGVECRTRQFF
jgi:starch synthase (maltosyl-transferring)